MYKYFENDVNDNGYTYKFKNEANYMLASLDDKVRHYYENIFSSILPIIKTIGNITDENDNTNFTDECVNIVNKFYKVGLFSPLTLNDDEFDDDNAFAIKYNKRYYNIYKYHDVIYNNNAYNIVVKRKYDADNKEELISNFSETVEQERVYINKGGVITGEYILDCIIPQHIVDKHCFTIQSVVKLSCSRIHYDDGRVLYTIDHRDPKLKVLREFYNVPTYIDNNVTKFKLDIRKYKKL